MYIFSKFWSSGVKELSLPSLAEELRQQLLWT